MGHDPRHLPEDYAHHPRFKSLRWSTQRYVRPDRGTTEAMWEGECRRCGATSRARPRLFTHEILNCGCVPESESTAAKAVSGATSELAVVIDLLTRGLRVYTLAARSQHPDLVVLDGAGHRTIEVRTVSRGGQRLRKPGDDCHHYAWVHRDGRIEYEPPLPAAEEEEKCPSTSTSATAAAA